MAVLGTLVPALGQDDTQCTFLGPQRERFLSAALARQRASAVSDLTTAVVARLPVRTANAWSVRPQAAASPAGSIDKYIFQALNEAGIAPAGPATDMEFARRVTLDLTGQVPAVDKLIAFANDTSPDKRSRLVEELLSSPAYVDRWTMFLGDLLKNTDRINSQGVVRYADGRNAFYQWIKTAVAENRPWNKIATEIISARGTNSYDPAQAAINWMVGGIVSGGPQQDIWDQQTANVAETFLGVGHMNCLLCHNGRGHLDSLSLWGKSTSRMTAWGMAAYLSHTTQVRTPAVQGQTQPYYWETRDTYTAATPNYRLNTTTGNRPARQPFGSTTQVAPAYPFNSDKPKAGEDYRESLARSVTSDFQFARNMVNRVFKEFFVLGLVEPVDQFDPMRLDPDNPPPAPWTLQPSNARLLNALAQDFIDSGYDLKALMRSIVNSRAYQLSSRYDGEWNPTWDRLYARKLVRRLWAEEIHDAIVQTSGMLPTYRITADWSVNWAMQLPEPRNLPGGATTTFLDSFLRGNREDADRRGEGSPTQALNLMNDPFVVTRTKVSGTALTGSLLARNINFPDDQLVRNLFLTVLSRYPNDTENQYALGMLKSGGNRTQQAENLLWTLYNKVDFFFNY